MIPMLAPIRVTDGGRKGIRSKLLHAPFGSSILACTSEPLKKAANVEFGHVNEVQT